MYDCVPSFVFVRLPISVFFGVLNLKSVYLYVHETYDRAIINYKYETEASRKLWEQVLYRISLQSVLLVFALFLWFVYCNCFAFYKTCFSVKFIVKMLPYRGKLGNVDLIQSHLTWYLSTMDIPMHTPTKLQNTFFFYVRKLHCTGPT